MKGEKNTAADTLLRTDHNSFDTGNLSQELIADKQKSNSTQQEVLTDTSLAFQVFPAHFSNMMLYCNVKLGFPRPFIPSTLMKLVIRHFYRLSHPSKRDTVKSITNPIVWPNMNYDIRDWISKCLEYQRCKVHLHTKSPISTFSTHDAHFSHIHMNIVLHIEL